MIFPCIRPRTAVLPPALLPKLAPDNPVDPLPVKLYT